MKWLVQTLDQLASHATDPAFEQKKLEELIARYKRLIPTIELTIIRTELYYKCFTYNREVKEVIFLKFFSFDFYEAENYDLLILWLQVCELLERVGASGLPRLETPSNISELVRAQELAVAQLDSQRSNIVSMLQRGRDLSKDPSAPIFVKNRVQQLDTQWNQAYNTTIEKLNTLKGSHI